jgi:hypothetical protein
MDFVAVASSTISGVGYDDATGVLAVRFNSGTEYHYYGVPRDVYEGFFSAPSVGQYFNVYVKRAGYAFQQTG